jgi:hypothetical protein
MGEEAEEDDFNPPTKLAYKTEIMGLPMLEQKNELNILDLSCEEKHQDLIKSYYSGKGIIIFTVDALIPSYFSKDIEEAKRLFLEIHEKNNSVAFAVVVLNSLGLTYSLTYTEKEENFSKLDDLKKEIENNGATLISPADSDNFFFSINSKHKNRTKTGFDKLKAALGIVSSLDLFSEIV